MTPDFIHRFRPGGGSSSTLLLLHGTGGDENDLVPIGAAVAPGAALLSPRGRVDENGMARFFRRMREGVFDEEDLRYRVAELDEWVLKAAERYAFDLGRFFALGYSNGANMAASLLLLRPRLLKGAVLMRALFPIEPETPPDLAGIPVLLLAGEHDAVLPRAATEKLAGKLSEAGASVEVRWHKLAHELGPEDFAAAKEFLRALI